MSEKTINVMIVQRHPNMDKAKSTSTMYDNTLFNVSSSCIPIVKLWSLALVKGFRKEKGRGKKIG